MLVQEPFSILKRCILIGLWEVSDNFGTAILGASLISLLIQNPSTKYRDKVWKWLQQGQCFICKKRVEHYFNLEITWNLQ